MDFAPGYRFHPSDQELVGYYLHRRATMGNQFRSNEIHECLDFYNQEPWIVWDNNGGSNVENGEPLFLFTTRRKTNPKCKRFQRKAGSGTWSGGNVPKVISDTVTGRLMGTRREFRYENGDDCAQNNCWLMTEYELSVTDVLVLCTLKKSPRNPPPSSSTSTAAAAPSNVNVKNDRKRKMVAVDDQQTKAPRLTCDQDQPSTSFVPVPNIEDSDIQHQPVEPVVDQPSTSFVHVPMEESNIQHQPVESVVDQDYHVELSTEFFSDLIQSNECQFSVEDLLPLTPPIPHMESSDQSNINNLVSNDQFEDLLYQDNNFMSLLSTEFQEEQQLGYNNFSLISID